LAPAEPWSFEDEVLGNIPEEQVRRIPTGGDHSMAWLVWHMARCEDITMNLLVAGTPQVLMQAGWLQKTRSPLLDTGNAMDAAALADFNRAIDVEALRGYRAAVGHRTREIVALLQPADLKRKVEASRLKRIFDEGAVVEAARGIADYWGNRDVAGLLLMPATRHNLIHLGEALKLKRKLRTI
jgi:hypothetical protein